MTMTAKRSWAELATVVGAIAALFLATTTITNSIVSRLENDINENNSQLEALSGEMADFREEFHEFKLDSSLSLQRIELQLQQLIHGKDLESPERIAQTQ